MPLITKFLFRDILLEAERIGIPPTKKRGIIREFLQSEILYHLYNLKESRHIVFTGGTSLRFLYGNQRLSEDLDFDLIKRNVDVYSILKKVAGKITGKQTDQIELKINPKKIGKTGYFKYKNLLYDLGISQYREEKLVIKFDFSYPEDKIEPINKVFTKFGYLQNVLAYDRSTLLSLKTRALITRKIERGRDLYDIAKLLSSNISPNLKIRFIKKMGIRTGEDYLAFLKKWHRKKIKIIPQLKNQLRPFLIDEEEIKYIDLI